MRFSGRGLPRAASSGGEAGGEESSIPWGYLGTLATGDSYAAESGSESIGAAVETAFMQTLQSEYPAATQQERTRWLRPSH